MKNNNKVVNTVASIKRNARTTDKEEPNYKKDYEILICYFDSISDEEQPLVHKQLLELGL